MTTLTRRRPAASSAPAILPATLHSLTRTGRGDIVVRQPRFAEGDVVQTVSGRAMTPAPRWDLTGPRKATASTRRMADWLRDNARAEAASRGLYCTIQDVYSDNALTPGDDLESSLILWGCLVVGGHRIGAPELWERPGGWTPEQIAERPPLITPARAQELLLALASNGPMPEWAEAYCTREAS